MKTLLWIVALALLPTIGIAAEICVEKATGDILVVKPDGAPWSAAERENANLIVLTLEFDAAGENKVKKEKVVCYPYHLSNGKTTHKVDWRKIKEIKKPEKAKYDNPEYFFATGEPEPVAP